MPYDADRMLWVIALPPLIFPLFPATTKSMSAKGACVACRVRKVRCVPGPALRCERCATMGMDDCVYEPIKKRGAGTILRMGEACNLCRSRKRKCDAGRPCTRCVASKMASKCEYEIVEPAPPRPLDHSQFLFWDESDPSASRDDPSRESSAVGNAIAGSSTQAQFAIITRPAIGTAPPALRLGLPLSGNGPPPYRPRPPLYAPNQVKKPNPSPTIIPPFAALLSRMPPRIPPEPHITLLLLGAEHFQLSDATLEELDMKFRLGVLRRLNKLGVRFTSAGQQALLRGDTSGTIIHPFFLPAAHCLGMYFCEGLEDSPPMIRLQARHLQKCFEYAAEIFRGHDWGLRAQAGLWGVSSAITLSIDPAISLYMDRGCEAVNSGGLRFVPKYGRPPKFSEELHEKLCVLSQIIYFENFLFLACGKAKPTMTARIEKEFRDQLPQVYPMLFKICPLTMRTKTILLVKDTVTLLSRFQVDGEYYYYPLPSYRPLIALHDPLEAGVALRRQSFEQQVALLDEYSQELLSILRRFEELGDKGGAEMIRICCINCFAHLAVLCGVIGDIKPEAGVDALCDSSLERLGELARDMCMEEYTRHDVLLGLSLEKAVGVFDARLAKIAPEDGAKLWRCKQIVVEVYLDLVARLPEANLPTLGRRALQEDGRTEGSQYPNLILRKERRPYGI